MQRRPIRVGTVLVACALMGSAPAAAQSFAQKPFGRISFYTNAARYDVDGVADPASLSEFITTFTYRAPDVDEDGLDYAIDVRHAAYASEGRRARVSIYDGYVGVRFSDGALLARVGHMWLNDLGALGSVAGALVEYRQPRNATGGARLRGGVFGGLEPKIYDVGYVSNVRKLGGYVALDGDGARRHVVGYVNVRNAGLTERSVVTFTNYVPIQQYFFLYQAAEYDLSSAAMADGGLTYFFANARVVPASRVELQGIYNRGRSIDTRSIIDAQLSGRPLTARTLEGLLYESAGGRVYVEVVRGVRAHVGYARDKTNREDAPTGRLNVGVHATNLAGTGLDVTVTDSRMDRPTGRYDSWYFSVGRQIGRRVYVSGDYSSSLSVVHLTGGTDPIRVDLRPRLHRFSGSGVITVGRSTSLLVTAERLTDDTVSELRLLAGISYRLH